METNAYFENIHEHLLTELGNANKDINAAIAWFTDPVIYDLLCEKAAEGIQVRLILVGDSINKGSNALDFKYLKKAGGEVFFVNPQSSSGSTMHNKFCVIDGETVITGSYNWTRKARKNKENITIISEDSLFAGQFLAAFNTILTTNGFKSSFTTISVDPALLLRRLELIRNLILLEETNEIDRHIAKLRAIESESALINIISMLDEEKYTAAVAAIGEYISKRQAISEYRDPEIDALRLELKSLELQINALDNEKIELEHLIHEFVVRQNQKLGGLLVEYLRIKRERLAKNRMKDPESNAAYVEASQDYEDYRKEYEEIEKEDHVKLSSEEQKEIKNAYRRASRLCHPDMVSDDDKEVAHEMFVSLNDAYRSNDLGRVKEILSSLTQGKTFIDKSLSITEKQRLEMEVGRIRRRMEQIAEEITQLRESETYRTISAIDDWDIYFSNQRDNLKKEIDSFGEEITTHEQ